MAAGGYDGTAGLLQRKSGNYLYLATASSKQADNAAQKSVWDSGEFLLSEASDDLVAGVLARFGQSAAARARMIG